MFPHAPLPGFVIGWCVATLLGGSSLVWLQWRAGLRGRQIVIVFATLSLALFAGSKLLYLFEASLDGFPDRGVVIGALWSARLRLPGGFLLALAIGPPLAWLIRVRYLWFADTVVPAAGLLIVGIRVGCFLDGCCYGTPSSLPWAVRFPAGSDAFSWQVGYGLLSSDTAASLPVHPLQLYFALAGLLIFVGLAAYQPHKRYDGELLLLFFVTYLWSTWLLETLRASPHALTRDVVLAGCVVVTVMVAVIECRRWLARRRSVLGGRPLAAT